MLKRIDRVLSTTPATTGTCGTPSAIARFRAAVQALNAAQAAMNRATTRTTPPAKPETFGDIANRTLAIVNRRRTAR